MQRRDQFRTQLNRQALGDIQEDEIESHFSGMPAHYWQTVTEAELIWGLQLVHQFLARLAAADSPPTMPVVAWKDLPDGSGTRLALCTWDRLGLLAKAAACLSTVELGIQQAEVFTRADNIVLDFFVVYDAGQSGCAASAKLDQMRFLLEGALSDPPRFASVWACSRHKVLVPPMRVTSKLTFDNKTSTTSTLLRVVTPDRMGLLHDILQSLAAAGVNLQQAELQTRENMAHDVFHLVEPQGGKLLDRARRESLRRALRKAIAVRG